MSIRLEQKGCSYLLADSIQDLNLQHSYVKLFERDYIKEHFGPVIQKRGRGQALVFKVGGKGLVLRHYYRGGLFGKLSGDRFFNWEPLKHRSFDEFKLLEYMYDQGLPVPRPVAARELKGPLWLRHDLVIEHIESQNLAEIIHQRALSIEECERIGLTIAKFFAAAIDHTDLNIRNILLAKSGMVYIIDFDKCFRSKIKLPSERKGMILSRLERSFNKEQQLYSNIFYSPQIFALIRAVIKV